jgi:hypothetical protein
VDPTNIEGIKGRNPMLSIQSVTNVWVGQFRTVVVRVFSRVAACCQEKQVQFIETPGIYLGLEHSMIWSGGSMNPQ